ncbi:MAG: hypothetical protein N2C14_05995 [Planctomycetales bacterium]
MTRIFGGLFLIFLSAANLPAEVITWSSTVGHGGIDGTDVTGEAIEYVVDFTDDQVFDATGMMVLSNATSSINLPDSFGLMDFDDSDFDTVRFGNHLTGLFIVEWGSPLSLTGTNGDNNEGLSPNPGETLSEFFARVGTGGAIAFTSDAAFSGVIIGATFNGGTLAVTNDDLAFASGVATTVTLGSASVPEPSGFLLLGLFGLFPLARRVRSLRASRANEKKTAPAGKPRRFRVDDYQW